MLQKLGKKIVIISNSSRRKGDTLARLRAMGFGPCEDEDEEAGLGRPGDVPPISVVTSGDLVFRGLSTTGTGALFDDLGMRCFVFGNGADDEEYVRDAGKVASPISQADFVLARGLSSMLGHGPDLLRQPAVPYSIAAEEEVLQAAMARRPGGLPLLVANPDLIRPDGQDSPMPGQLAYRYQALGATDVRLVGKPHKLIYERCRSLLARAGLGRDARVAAVGDSLHHDVLGAARNGVDSILCCSGVHSTELGLPQAGALPPNPERLQALLEHFGREHEGVAPTHVLAAFRL
jgi:ribonucleotide monophosphatase NagD (HAD superfamily)